MKLIARTNLVYNLRYRWKEELKNFTDDQLCQAYCDFIISDEYGNNDEKFPEWFDQIGEYPKTKKWRD